MKKDLASVRHVKRMASRDDSAGLLALAMGFRDLRWWRKFSW
jgi:hypothetical protein